MDSTELLHILREEARKISNEDICLARTAVFDSVQDLPEKYRKSYSSDYFSYLYGAFQELRTCTEPEMPDHVDPGEHRELISRITRNASEGNTKERAFCRFAAVVIPYLALITKRTIHPVGMVFPGGFTIASHEGEYYCPVKNKQTGVDVALCDFCRCRDSGEI